MLRRRVLKPGIGVLAGLLVCLTAACAEGTGAAGPTTTLHSRVVHLGQTPVAPVVTQGLNLPAVGAAADAACDSDFKTLRAAENEYNLLNGSYTTIQDLVNQQFLRTASAYYVGIKIGTPAGGYTLLAAPSGPCVSLPVREPN